MGIIYHIEPLDDEMAALLEEMGAAAPEAGAASRNPTPAEVRRACAALKGFETTFNVKAKSRWQAVIRGTGRGKDDQGTILNVEKFRGSEDRPHAIWFEKGSPALILEIVKRLSTDCGPLVVLPDTGDTPIAVSPKASIKKLLKEWDGSGDG
jgi:hypothetical protein